VRESAERRARRLVRCYPGIWRARYGEEFTEFLADDISERPRSMTRTADILRTALLVRLESAGLAGDPLAEPQNQMRSGLATLTAAISAFITVGVAVWSQLTIGWQWSAPATGATKTGMVLMSGAMLGIALLAVLAAIPLAWVLSSELARGRGKALAWPLVATGIGAPADRRKHPLRARVARHRWPSVGWA
jgi:hypothetical protein